MTQELNKTSLHVFKFIHKLFPQWHDQGHMLNLKTNSKTINYFTKLFCNPKHYSIQILHKAGNGQAGQNLAQGLSNKF